MTTSKNIHDLISAYLNTKDLDTFAASFAEVFYDIENTASDPSTLQLAYDVESALAAMGADVCSEEVFYASMKALSPSLSFVIVGATIVSQSLMTYSPPMKSAAAAGTGKLVHVDTAPSVGFGSTTVLPDTHQTSTGLPPWQQVIPAR